MPTDDPGSPTTAGRDEERVPRAEGRGGAPAGAGGGRSSKSRSRRRRPPAARRRESAGAEEEPARAGGRERRSRRGGRRSRAGRQMLISADTPEETRVAILEDGQLDDLHVERSTHTGYLNNIYVGRVVNIEPSIGAAFVDFGGERNGFLHASDIVPGSLDRDEATTADEPRPIQSLVRRGQTVVVQITKDGIGNKGPTLTTNLSVPGRYLVLMPYLGRFGVSRKIPDKEERRRLKNLLDDLDPPKNLGVIIRTAGVDRTKAELQKDLRYLLNLWEVISHRIQSARGPTPIYQESDLIIRTIRDSFTSDIDRIVADSEAVAKRCRDFLEAVMPRYKNRVEIHRGRAPLFHEFGVEEQIERIYDRRIPLPSGGSVVIEPTEALVAVDVNSGRFRENEDPEETALVTDLEAIPVILRQIRLRDLGGLLIIDFIDVQDEKHRRTIEREMRAALKRDRARTKMTRMSEFGIVEVTRQRVRPAFESATVEACVHCQGTGRIRTVLSQVLAVLRQIRAALARRPGEGVEVTVHPEVANALLNDRRAQLLDLEHETGRSIRVLGDPAARRETIDLRILGPPSR